MDLDATKHSICGCFHLADVIKRMSVLRVCYNEFGYLIVAGNSYVRFSSSRQIDRFDTLINIRSVYLGVRADWKTITI